MPKTSLSIMAVALCSGAAAGQQVQPLIDRPLTLAQGGADFTLLGTYTNWNTGAPSTSDVPSWLDGETIAFGFDYGATDETQVGLALAFPAHPGATFGSALGSVLVSLGGAAALRLDAGMERVGLNGGDIPPAPQNHFTRYFAGVGSRIRIPVGSNVALVSGRTGTAQFGHFNNIGRDATGLYDGATDLPDGSCDFFVVSVGTNDTPTIFGLNLPAGLLMQIAPSVALTLFTGYSGVLRIPGSGGAHVVHFVPAGLELLVTPFSSLELGLRFHFDGYVGVSGNGESPAGAKYFDMRALTVWVSFRV